MRAAWCAGMLLLTGLGQDTISINRVAWLTGCWESRSPRDTVEEQWMAPRGRTMIGMGRTIRGDSLFEFEQIVLRERDGRLVYEAHPSGQARASFTSTTVTDSSVVFENLQHDFPQLVGYDRRGTDSLIAWIEGPRGGQMRRIPFPYARVRCGG